jgi:hypothetical protein
MADTIDLSFAPNSACPCGSETLYKSCHLNEGGLPLSILKPPTPPGPVTGSRNEGCYLGVTNNCSEKLSREHWLSEAILRQIPDLSVIGLPRTNGERRRVGPKALTAKILCSRHNSALSPLDQAAANAFRTLDQALQHLLNPVQNRSKNRKFLIDGSALELWALKFCLGAYVSVLNDGETPASARYSLDVDKLALCLDAGKLDAPLGLYWARIRQLGANAAASCLVFDESKMGGMIVTLRGTSFDILLDEAASENVSTKKYRPRGLLLKHGPFAANVWLAWHTEAEIGDRLYRVDVPADVLGLVPLIKR